MKPKSYPTLSRRERQIMDILFRLSSATASDVRRELPDAPGYSAVRTMLTRLEDKGHVSHEQNGPRYVYRPTVGLDAARASALERMVRTFFEGSPGKTVAAILDRVSTELSDEELEDLSRMLEDAKDRRER